jgi:hypothetical protein
METNIPAYGMDQLISANGSDRTLEKQPGEENSEMQ